MIEATILRDEGKIFGFRIRGHAECVTGGEYDLVCCAVSILTENTVNSIETLTTDRPLREEVQEGFLDFELSKECTEASRLLMDAMLLGLKSIETQYGKHLTIRFEEE